MEKSLNHDKWNKLLPYETDAPEKVFADIKKNIAFSVQQKDLTRGLKFWSDQLSTFIKIYGYQVPIPDMVTLVKLYYSLVVQEDINIPVVGCAGRAFTLLLGRQKAKKMIAREDLVLDWRPLYKTFKEIFHGKDRVYNLKVGYPQLESVIRHVVGHARDYFSEESTGEMLAEWEPLLCPPDSMCHRGTTYLSCFLPVTVSPNKGFRLWLDMVLGLVKSTAISFGALLRRVAKFNVGQIDWTPHIPWVFNVLLLDFNLPVGESHTFAGLPTGGSSLFSSKIELVVWMLGGDSTDLVLEHLEILTKTYISYIHPSNKGKWTMKLVGFVNIICETFLKRVEMEQLEQGNWLRKVPESHQLDQNTIDRFVKIMLPSVKLVMFNVLYSSNGLQHDFHCLVRLAPHIVLPDFTDHAYQSIESLVEPQRVTTALCSFAVSLRAMCLHEPSRQHVVPILQTLLPTISSNDLNKSWIALLAFSFAFTMIPVVDCSHLVDQPGKKRKELERVWRSTAQFKDMVAVFLDKLFSLIEVSAMEDTGNLNSVSHKNRTSKTLKASSIPDYLAEGSIYMSFDSLVRNSSDDIRELILDKMFRYITTTTMEVKIAGKTMGDALSNLSNIYTERTLKKFLPHLTRECAMLLEEESESGETSQELLWNFTMFRSLLRGRGDLFLPYLPEIQTLLEATLQHHNSRQLVTIAVKAVSDLLHLLLKVKPTDCQSCQVPYTDRTFDFTSTWGLGMEIEDVKIDWYLPGEKEYPAMLGIIERFGVSSINKLRQFVADKNTCKEQFHVQLKVLRAVTKTAGHMMPMLGRDSEVMVPKYGGKEVDESVRVPIVNLDLQTGLECQSDLLTNFRERAADTVKVVYEYQASNMADDVKSAEMLCLLLEDVLTYKGYDNQKMKKEHTKYKSVKQLLDNRLLGSKKQLRMVVIHRLLLQQQYRQHAQLFTPYTKSHHNYTQCLVDMSLSKYTAVRKTAQHCLKKCLSVMLNSRWFFIPQITKFLEPREEISHEELKGAIFCLRLPRITAYFAPQPMLLCQVMPALCAAQHSEKDSIINSIEHLTDNVIDEYRTCSFNTAVSGEAVSYAEQLAGKMSPDLIRAGQDIAQLKDQLNRESFDLCIERLLEILKSDKTTWRFLDLTVDVVRTMVQREMKFSEDLVSTFLYFLTHDSIGLRMISFRVVGYIMYLQRRAYQDTLLDPSTFPADGAGSLVGERPSNMWLQYREKDLPDTEEKYNKCIFVDKPHTGYNKWAEQVRVCIEIDRDLDNEDRFSPIDKIIVSRFKDESFVSRFVELYSLEDNKGAEKVDIIRRHFYRDLFRNYGWSLFKLFLPKVEEFVEGKVESQHRFAAELLSSVTRGSKHWPFKDIELMWETILPLIMKAMIHVSAETINLWAVCISSIVEDRDPRRFSRLVTMATEEFLSGRTIFHDTSNLFLLETIVAQFEWKYAEGLHKLMDKIIANLNNSYKNVRDKIGHMIERCTAHDHVMFNCRPTINPRKADFMAKVMPLLSSLDETLFGADWVLVNKMSINDDNDAIKVVKTVISWLLYSHAHLVPSVFPFLSYIIALEPSEADPDLKNMCTRALSVLSRESLTESSLGPAVAAVKRVVYNSEERAVGSTWKAKCTALVYLQVVTFSNLYIIRALPEVVAEIKSLLFSCLSSPHVEVRQVAGQTIGGLMKTDLFRDNEDILLQLKEMALTKLPPGTKPSQTDTREIWERHGGVKSLCALVECYPYSIPSWMPGIIVFLAQFTRRGNVMISNEVKKCMSNFKRTHLDSWEEHKTLFSEDQLSVLQDLLVSPNYYA
ncbi:hypothetical protein ACHWQZ_G014676 [Mnemiopsis leidyi]